MLDASLPHAGSISRVDRAGADMSNPETVDAELRPQEDDTAAKGGASGLPDEAFVPVRIVLDEGSFDRVVERMEAAAIPTSALRELMRS